MTKTDNDLKRTPTIIDVAGRADVAIGTVSRYLNGLPMRGSNRDAVETAISELGYRRNAVAAAMKTEKTRVIGLLVPAFDEFHSAVLEHLARTIRRTERALLTYCHSNEPKIFREAVSFLADQRVDAVIADGTEVSKGQMDILADRHVPLVLYNDVVPHNRADRVVVDNLEASRRAVGHLLDLGHERIGIITGNLKDSTARLRLQGYERALAERGVPVDPDLVVKSDWGADRAYAGMKALMAAKPAPTALFGSNYQITIGALTWLKEHAVRVPADFSLVSFDDVALFRLHESGITAVAQPVLRIAQSITDLLLMRLNGPQEHQSETVTLGCDIILRGSTRALPRRRQDRKSK